MADLYPLAHSTRFAAEAYDALATLPPAMRSAVVAYADMSGASLAAAVGMFDLVIAAGYHLRPLYDGTRRGRKAARLVAHYDRKIDRLDASLHAAQHRLWKRPHR